MPAHCNRRLLEDHLSVDVGLCQNRGRSFQYLLLEWLHNNRIANREFTAGEDKTAHPAPSLQRVPRPYTNRLLHARAGIARRFDEDVHLSYAEPLPDQVIKVDTPDDHLASACPGRNGSSAEMLDRRQHFSLDQRKLATTIPM